MSYASLVKWVKTLLVSALPVGEFRAGIPYGLSLGLSAPSAFVAGVLGTWLPCLAIVYGFEPVSAFLREAIPLYRKFDDWLLKHTKAKSKIVVRFGLLGLLLLTALSGAYTACLVGSLLRLSRTKILATVLIGVMLAGFLITSAGQMVLEFIF